MINTRLSPSQIVAAFESKGYRLKRNGEMNPFGIRSKNRTAGVFDDLLGYLVFRSGSPEVKLYEGTTDPGTYYLQQRLLNSKGCAILKSGQYRDTYIIDQHNGKYYALCQRNDFVTVYRDADRDKVLDMDPAATQTGKFGINIHYDSYSGSNAANILHKASAGCQVFRKRTDFFAFMAEAKRSRSEFENLFDYTLFDEADFEGQEVEDEGIESGFCQSCGQVLPGSGDVTSSTEASQMPIRGPEKHRLLERWDSMRITRLVDQGKRTAQSIVENRARYEQVASQCGGVPWYLIGVIHAMESSLGFSKHLHNGDSLASRTVRVPKGRPATGSPPFSWEESAIDAIQMKSWHKWKDWRLSDILDRLERYNGSGYRKYHQDVPSPYLWSGSQHYTKGKYVADGNWSSSAVSKQVGGAILLRRIFDIT